MQIVNIKLMYFNMIMLDVFSVCPVESEFCIYRRINFSCDSSIKPKRVAILFYKKVVPFNFGFGSFGNEQNFLSNQNAGKLINVTRNKLYAFITKL